LPEYDKFDLQSVLINWSHQRELGNSVMMQYKDFTVWSGGYILL